MAIRLLLLSVYTWCEDRSSANVRSPIIAAQGLRPTNLQKSRWFFNHFLRPCFVGVRSTAVVHTFRGLKPRGNLMELQYVWCEHMWAELLVVGW